MLESLPPMPTFRPGERVTIPAHTPMSPWPGVPDLRRNVDAHATILGKSTDDSRMVRVLWRNNEYQVYAREIRRRAAVAV